MSFHIREAERLSHAYIISAADPEQSRQRAREIAAAAVCRGTGELPCGNCRACRKVQADIHPDVITIRREADSKGEPRREITVNQVRAVSADAVVLPNESERKVYIVEDADMMNLSAQNAALKLLEEPPRGVVFLLCVRNVQQLLPTVRSRCAEINCNGEAAAEEEESRALAARFIRTAAEKDPATLFRWCAKNEEMDKRAASAFLASVGRQLADMICLRSDRLGMSRGELMRLWELTERLQAWLNVNVSVKHIFGLLSVNAIESRENRG